MTCLFFVDEELRRNVQSYWSSSIYNRVLIHSKVGNHLGFDRCEQVCNLECDGTHAQNLLMVISATLFPKGVTWARTPSRPRTWRLHHRVHRNRQCQHTSCSNKHAGSLLPSRTLLLIRMCARLAHTHVDLSNCFCLLWPITKSSSV